MRNYMKLAKSFTIEPDLNEYVATTKGTRSASERVNDMLRRAMLEEQYEKLEREAAIFFAAARKESRREVRSFQRASLRTLSRD
jgi:hypothetical protein